MGAYMTIYLAAVNLLTFYLFWSDKQRAKKEKWRIPERTLLGLSLLGGSAGAWFGMKLFHHKTKHKKFYLGIPAILVVQAVILMYVYF